MSQAMKEVLVATDFSEESDEALAPAIDLAKQTGANLQVVHALENGADQFPFGLPFSSKAA